MSSKLDKQVMCIEDKDLDSIIEMANSAKKDEFNEVMINAILSKSFFKERSLVENDPSIRHIIPYVVITHDKDILTYQRTIKGNEVRLHDMYSLGFGGHVEYIPKYNRLPRQKRYGYTLIDNIEKELKEEILPPSFPVPNIYDDAKMLIRSIATEVDKVHLGIVYKLAIDEYGYMKEDLTEVKENKLCNLSWRSVEECKNLHFESWSTTVLDVISNTGVF